MSKEVITEELKKLKTTKERRKNESRISTKKLIKTLLSSVSTPTYMEQDEWNGSKRTKTWPEKTSDFKQSPQVGFRDFIEHWCRFLDRLLFVLETLVLQISTAQKQAVEDSEQ